MVGGGANVCNACYASKYTPMEFEFGRKLYLPCRPPSQLRANYSDNRANPSAKLRFSALVSIARIDYIVHLRASTTVDGHRGSLYPSLSLVSVHSDSHLHLRSFPALSLCSRPFSRSPAPRTDLTIPRVGNYVATGETREFASSVFLSLVSTLAPDPFATTKSRGYFRSVPWLNFHRRTVRPLDRARRFRSFPILVSPDAPCSIHRSGRLNRAFFSLSLPALRGIFF